MSPLDVPASPPNPLDSWWPWRKEAAPARLLWIAAVLSLFGAWSFVRAGVGAGLSVCGLTLLAVAVWHADRSNPVWRGLMTLLSAALWTIPTWRDATWVVLLALLAAAATTWFAVAMPSRLLALPRLAMAPLVAVPDGLAWAWRGGRQGAPGRTTRIVKVAGVSMALAVVFGGLFAAADAAFASVLSFVVPPVSPALLVLRLLVAATLLPVIIGLFYLARSRPRFDHGLRGRPEPSRRWEWIIPLTVVNAIFALFIIVQAHALFGGVDYLLATSGLTYAEYARGGFWQLSVVAVLSLAVIAVAAWRAPLRSRSDRLIIRVALGALCLMSLVVVASALYRMNLYSEAFGLTRLRVLVFAAEVWLALVFVLVLVCGSRLKVAWLGRAVVSAAAVTVLALAAVNPDGLIAHQNLNRYDATGDVDFAYLVTLSADAVPELAERVEGLDRVCLLSHTGADTGEDAPISWNLSRHVADELVRTSEPVRSCSWLPFS